MATMPPGGGHNFRNSICGELYDKIMELVFRNRDALGVGGTKGLVYRFSDQINGANGPGTRIWETHDQAIRDQQRGVRNRLLEWDDNDCGPPPPGAEEWATRPPPTAADWKGPPQETNYVETAAKVGVVAVVAYGAYRVVRMLPSLIPAFWWTIPANAAIP